MTRVARALHVWRNLRFSQKLFVLASPKLLLISDLSLRMLGYQRTRSLLRLMLPSFGRTPADPRLELRQRALLLRAVSLRLPFRSDCLRQSVVLWAFAQRWGVDAEIRFGVDESAEHFGGHAWVEMSDTPVWPEDPALPRTRPLSST